MKFLAYDSRQTGERFTVDQGDWVTHDVTIRASKRIDTVGFALTAPDGTSIDALEFNQNGGYIAFELVYPGGEDVRIFMRGPRDLAESVTLSDLYIVGVN